MTLETYEKAQEIRSEIDHMMDLRNTLVNAVGKVLQCVDHRQESSIVNRVSLKDEPIIHRLVDVIDDEIRVLQTQFNDL